MAAAIRLSGVCKSYNGLKAVSDFSVEVREGALYGLLGPNGAGKTTTIRMILSIILPDAGTIEIFGHRAGAGANAMIGYLPEEHGLYRKMKVGEMLHFLAELKGMQRAAARRAIGEWLDRLQLSEWRERRIEELSKGMEQKLQFVATVLHDPPLLILDEPFSGLDPINSNLLKDIVLEKCRAGRTIVFSTHRMDQVEQLCDSIGLINKSRLILAGDPSEIRREYGRNTVIVQYDGADASVLARWEGVEKVNGSGRQAEVVLRRDADSHEYLRYLVNLVRVHRFEVVAPSLEQIFIEKVTESNEDCDRVGDPR